LFKKAIEDDIAPHLCVPHLCRAAFLPNVQGQKAVCAKFVFMDMLLESC
jgi:hypothetical protein